MTQSETVEPAVGDNSTGYFVWLKIAALVYLLLIGVAVIGGGFKWVSGGSDGAAQIFAFASNPIVGVILGTFATALVQSSSTVTSVIVGLVAGGMPVSIAVPMIMGANMGTTVTNTIVSMGSFRDRTSFRQCFQAATVHDFFNLFAIVIFLPIEMLFKPLERMAGSLASWFEGGGDASMSGMNFVGAATKPVAKAIITQFKALPEVLGPYLAIALGIGMIIVSVVYLGKILRRVMTGSAKGIIENTVGRGPVSGVASGTVVTILVQSSSTTTSLIVPLAGAGTLTTRQVYPFTLGANIGTCVTALLAATAITGGNEIFALQIALVHLLYNVIAVVVFLTVPWLKELPVRAAEGLGYLTAKNRGWAFAYTLGVFFMLPGAVLGAQTLLADSEAGSEVGSVQAVISENEVDAAAHEAAAPADALLDDTQLEDTHSK